MITEKTMFTVKKQITLLVHNLTQMGYVFADPQKIITPPHPETKLMIAAIEQVCGTLPEALKSFYEIVGGVNLIGSHSQWKGCEYPDPLFIYPIADVMSEFQQWQAGYAANMADNIEEPFRIPIAPDFYHKANVSGGMWYNVPLPNKASDPIIHDEPHQLSFIQYLQLCFKWGGFPGLANTPQHNWSIAQLIKNLQIF
ncbi:MAG: hypothetical protein WCW27_04565 [Patescibacteria group bacterium]|jgi:hypothetical protein